MAATYCPQGLERKITVRMSDWLLAQMKAVVREDKNITSPAHYARIAIIQKLQRDKCHNTETQKRRMAMHEYIADVDRLEELARKMGRIPTNYQQDIVKACKNKLYLYEKDDLIRKYMRARIRIRLIGNVTEVVNHG